MFTCPSRTLLNRFDFYSTLFAAEPIVAKPDYAKWMLDDPRVNFAISTRTADGLASIISGIQVETPDELHEVYERLQQADRPVLEEGETTCCYAKSEKSWITDPQGVSWETFLNFGRKHGLRRQRRPRPDPHRVRRLLHARDPQADACLTPPAAAPARGRRHDSHDLPQPGLRHLAQRPRPDPQQRRRAA